MAKKKEPEAPVGEDERPKKLRQEESVWGERLMRAKRFQRKYSSGWEENRRLIFGENDVADRTAGAPPWAGGGKNSVAYGWGLYEGLETTIYVQNPDVIVSAHAADRAPEARRLMQIVRYDIDQMNAKDIGNLCLLDTFICGYGSVIESVETYQPRNEDGYKTGDVTGQDFQLRRIDPHDILFDPTSRRLDLSDCKYLFTAWYPTIEDLRNDENVTDLPKDIEDFPECSEYSRMKTPPEGPAERQAATLTHLHGTGSGEKDPAYKTICVWEAYDKISHEVLYVTDNKHYIIGRAKWPTNLRFGCRDLYPVTLLYQHPVPGRFYPRPEAELIAPQLREINVTERIISEDSRTKWRKYVTLSGILSEDQKSKITDTQVANALIFVDGSKLTEALGVASQVDPSSFDLNKLVAKLDDVSPPRDLFARFQMLEQEIFHIVGYGPNQRGGLPSTRSAREAMMINTEKERKLDKRRDRISDFYRYISMKHVRFLQEYMSIPRYAKVFPKAVGLEEWVRYDRTDISGDFEFEVVAGSSAPKNTEVRKASELQLFQTIAPILMQAGLPLRPAFERLAEYMDWDNVDDLFANVKAKAQQTLAAMVGFSKAQVPAEQLLNVVAQLLMAEMSPAEFEMARKQLEGGAPQAGAGPDMKGMRGDVNPMGTTAGTMMGAAP